VVKNIHIMMKTALIKQKMNFKFHFKYLGTYLIPRCLTNVHTRLKLTFQFKLSDTSFRMIRDEESGGWMIAAPTT